jgi:hypothetical protein
MKTAHQKSPPCETQGLPGLFAAVQAALMQVFTVTVFAGPAHMQHIPVFVFDE